MMMGHVKFAKRGPIQLEKNVKSAQEHARVIAQKQGDVKNVRMINIILYGVIRNVRKNVKMENAINKMEHVNVKNSLKEKHVTIVFLIIQEKIVKKHAMKDVIYH